MKTQRRSESSCERRMRLGRHSPVRILQAPLPSVLNYVTVTRPAKATENRRCPRDHIDVPHATTDGNCTGDE